MNRSEFVDQYYKIAERALKCSELARREGLLALEDALREEKINERDIFEYGLRFVIDGDDIMIIRDILSNIIHQEKDEYSVRLKNIQLEAVLSIQAGEHTMVLHHKLNSFTDIPINEDETQKYLSGSLL